jgi:uncharacterized membrane protein HdeD (DUF308 family)
MCPALTGGAGLKHEESKTMSDSLEKSDLGDLIRNWWLFLLLGIGLIALGLFAIVWAWPATLAVAWVFGVLLMAGGLLEIVNAFGARRWGGFFLHLLLGILYLVVGENMVESPIDTAAFLTLLLAVLLLVGGIARVVVALTHRFYHWGWMLLSGVVSLLLGVLIWRHWPEATPWLIGTFVGIELLFTGWSWVVLALTARSMPASLV